MSYISPSLHTREIPIIPPEQSADISVHNLGVYAKRIMLNISHVHGIASKAQPMT